MNTKCHWSQPLYIKGKMMNVNQVVEALKSKGFVLDEVKEIANANQVVFTNGSKVNVYHSGKVVVAGKEQELVKGILGLSPNGISSAQSTYQTKGQNQNNRATCKFNQAAKPISSKLNFLTF